MYMKNIRSFVILNIQFYLTWLNAAAAESIHDGEGKHK